MEKFGDDFLREKYWANEKFRKGTEAAALRTQKRTGKRIPNTPSDRIENYLNRFKEITYREDPKTRERGIAAIEQLVEQKYIVKPENISDEYIKSMLLGNEAELLGYEREDIRNEEIKQMVLSSLERKIHSRLDTYIVPAERRASIERMIITDQKSRMTQWLRYLTGEEAHHASVAVRYWAFAEMLKQGDYDPVRGEYNKRTDATVAIFPELDQQALALVFDEVGRRRAGKVSTLSIDETRQAEFGELCKNENFGRLYAFMQEHVRLLKSPADRMVITEGEWKVFPRGSSPQDLTASLQGFQTKWCIAGEGHARSYLGTSDVLIYFSKDAEGQNTIPRACIIDNKEEGIITEVRGIIFNTEVKQHLDDYIIPVVDEKLRSMGAGGQWLKQMEDMKRLRELHFKHLQKESFTKDELSFLYAIDRPIQRSGYGEDPRIKEMLSRRDLKADLSTILSIPREQISTTQDEALSGNIKYHYGYLYLDSFTSGEEPTLPSSIGGDLFLSTLTVAPGLTLPRSIGGDLDLSRLTSAEGLTLPTSIGGHLELGSLTSAEGLKLPTSVGGNLYLSSLISAQGLTLPTSIGGGLYLGKLISAEGLTLPGSMGGHLDLRSLTSAVGLTFPRSVGDTLNLRSLTSAQGLTLPNSIGGDLGLVSLISAQGLTLPTLIGRGLYLDSLASAEGLTFPTSIGGTLDLDSLPPAEKEKLRTKFPHLSALI